MLEEIKKKPGCSGQQKPQGGGQETGSVRSWVSEDGALDCKDFSFHSDWHVEPLECLDQRGPRFNLHFTMTPLSAMGDQECGQGDQLYHKASELKLQNSALYARAPSKTPAMHPMVICFVKSQKWDIVTTMVVETTWSLSWFLYRINSQC